jgi:23S rRNA-intervening sequence protein
MKESPLFLRSFELLEWLLNHTRAFPKHQRFVLAKRMEDAALSFHDELLRATKLGGPAEALVQADFHLARLRTYGRLALRLKLSSFAQYEHLAGRLDELGRLLGGWQRRLTRSAAGGGRGTGRS